MSGKKYLIIVGGPTASGKTGLAIRLARHYKTEILSADSRQFFKEMTIGTAKPSREERLKVPHHLVNHISIHQKYNVGDFEREALQLLEQLYEKHDVVILAGGSGLYIKALCEGLDQFPEVPEQIRMEIEQLYQHEGIKALQEALKMADPDYYAEVDLNNPHRLIRALSICESTGKPFSKFRSGKLQKRNFAPIYIQLHHDRKSLYQRINRRVDQMMEDGLLEEAKQLQEHKQLSALQTVGYQELFRHLDGELSLPEATDLIKQNSRRYAKRQLTWNRRDGYWKHFRPEEWDICLDYLDLVMREGILLKSVQEEKSYRLQILLQKKPEAAFRLFQSKNELLIEPETLSMDKKMNTLLWHEALLRAEERSIFCLTSQFPSHIEGTRMKAENLPKSLKKAIDDSDITEVWHLKIY